jgi:Mce-associated membrane protein
MTGIRPTSGREPWLVAAVLGAIAVVLAAVLLFVIRPAHNRHAADKPELGLTSSEQQAVDAAAKQVVNILTYSRKSFDADYARTLSGATGALRSDLAKQRATLKSQMIKGKYDLQGAVTSSAFEQINDKTSLVLVSAQGYKLPSGKPRTLASTARFEITMKSVNGKWLASDLSSVGLI